MSISAWPRAARERNIGRIIRAVISTAIIAVAMIMIPPVTTSIANQDIFNKTGEACSSCHTPPVSNGVLNQHGEDFRAKFFGSGAAAPPVVAPQCPPGFALSGGQCVKTTRPAACRQGGVICNGDAECCSGKCWLDNNTPPARCGHIQQVVPQIVPQPVPQVASCASGFYRCKFNRGGRIDPNNPDCCLHVPGIPHAK